MCKNCPESVRKLLVEMIGTFFLVAVIGFSGDPLAIGVGLIVMLYAGGAVSGAHYNPAVSFAVFLRGKMTFAEMIPYMIVQIIGAAAAAMIVVSQKGTPMLTGSFETGPALLAEIIFTFGLTYTVLMVATAKKTAGNPYFGIAIGGMVMAGAYSVGSISGGVFNPAVAIALPIMGKIAWSSIWIYFVANFAAAILAAAAFRLIHPDDK